MARREPRWCACCSEPLTGTRRTYCGPCGDPTNLRFEVETAALCGPFKAFAEAVTHAVGRSLSSGEPINVDVLCWSRAAAHAFGCLDDYDSDPEASVTKRVTITATDHGRVA